MKFTVTRTFAAPRDKIFAMITDPSVLQRCIDVCEKIEKTGEDSYNAHLNIRIAGLKRSYIAKVQIRDKKAPESCTLLVDAIRDLRNSWVNPIWSIRISMSPRASE